MRVRPTHAPALSPAQILRPFLALVLLAVAPLAASAQLRMTLDDLERGLSAVERGEEIPLANRPLPRAARVNDRLLNRLPDDQATAQFVAPEEFGVVLEYDGGRVALEAAGVRVVTQVGDIFTARMRREEIGRLRTVRGLKSARLAHYARPNLNVSAVDVRSNLEHAPVGSPPTYNGRAGLNMIIGDVDSGIDFTRSEFMDGLGKTRILYIWDQSDGGGPGPAGFGYGSEWTKNQIDNTPGSVRQVDSDGHGTAVAGVLIGNGSQTGCALPAYRYVGMAPLAQFIEVKTDFSDAGIIDGVNYIFQKAAALGKDAVVNLSLGSQFSPHDGSDTFGTGISGLTGPGKIVVASAGNDQEDLIHGKVITTSTTVGVDRIVVNVPSHTKNAGAFNDYFLVTGWYDPTASFTIRVKGPFATDTLSVGFGAAKDRSTTGGKIWVVNQNAAFGYGGTIKGRQFEVEVYDSIAANGPRIGAWEIDIVANGAANLGKRVDTWIYASQLGPVGLATTTTGLDNTTLVGSPADGDSVFAVGAHATKGSWISCASGSCGYSIPPTLNAIASFSCIGPRRDGVLKPEITAPGFGVATTHSSQAPAIGVCGDADDGVHEIEAGTSFSAPHVAGAASLFLSAYPGSSPSRVKKAFEAHARTDGFTGSVPNNTWGYGKLDIYGTFDHVGPTLALSSPNGGESWGAGTVHNITWSASDFSGVTSIDLAYSTDGGGSYPNVVATGIANTGSYAWTLPLGLTSTARVRVTARDAFNNSTIVSSAANFAIVDGIPPTVAVTAPVASEVLEAGASYNVTYTFGDNIAVTGLDVDYSSNDGGSWSSLATGLPGSPYAWSVPGAVVPQGRVRVTAHDGAGNTAASVSGRFSIVDTTPPAIALISPNGGESWTEATSHLIDWNATDLVGVSSVAVEYSIHGASGPWLSIATVAPDTSGFLWTVPAGPTDSAMVRVTALDASTNTASASSAALFQILGSAVGVPPLGDVSFALLPPAPNPGSGTMLFRYRLPAVSDATLEIYGANGQRVWTDTGTALGVGEHSVTWNGRDASGSRAPAGLYFARLTTAFGTRNAKLVRLN